MILLHSPDASTTTSNICSPGLENVILKYRASTLTKGRIVYYEAQKSKRWYKMTKSRETDAEAVTRPNATGVSCVISYYAKDRKGGACGAQPLGRSQSFSGKLAQK